MQKMFIALKLTLYREKPFLTLRGLDSPHLLYLPVALPVLDFS